MTWEALYNFLGVKEFIYYISSPQLQDMLFPVKMIFVTFAMFFFAGVVYFMINSSWLQYKFLEDVTEFFSWQSYGSRETSKRWNKIKKRVESGLDSEFKLAIIEADDFLIETLEERGYEGKDFNETVEKAGKLVSSIMGEIMAAHEARNSVVYDPDFKLDAERAKKVLNIYEQAINSIGLG